MSEKSASDRNLAFDGLRGIAAIAVAWMHMAGGMFPRHGFLAVDIFFLLSGFVVAGAYEQRLVQGAGAGWFFRVRMARLYPLYVFGLALGVSALISTPLTLFRAAAFNLFFLPDLFPADKSLFPLDGPLWSLTAELVVNMLYAWGGYRLSNRALVRLIGVAGLGLAGVSLVAGTADLGWHAAWNDLAGASARVLFAFPLGVLVFRLHRAGRFSSLGYSAVLPMAMTVAIFFLGDARPLVDVALMLIATPLLFLALLRAKPVSGAMRSACGWLGRMSYPIYVVHSPVIRLFSHVRLPVSFGTLLLQIPSLTPLVLVLALVATVWIEPAGRRLVARALTPPRAAGA